MKREKKRGNAFLGRGTFYHRNLGLKRGIDAGFRLATSEGHKCTCGAWWTEEEGEGEEGERLGAMLRFTPAALGGVVR
jgi:hypothetical protein